MQTGNTSLQSPFAARLIKTATAGLLMFKGAEGGNPTPSQLYKALVAAEHRGQQGKPLNDPSRFIRTRHQPPEGSTAYGPAQVTKRLVEGYQDKYPDVLGDVEPYTNKYVQQGEKFVQYGGEPHEPGYQPRYDYGGKGDLHEPKYRDKYHQMAKNIVDHMYQQAGEDTTQFVEDWRGAGPEEDPPYYKAFRHRLQALKQQPDANQTQSQKGKTTTAPSEPSGEGQGIRTYTVQKGDTLSDIADRQYGDSSRWRSLSEHNKLENPDHIEPGQKLEIPDTSGAKKEGTAMKRAGQAQAPNYGPAQGPSSQKCSNCKHASGGKCDLYNFKFNPSYVCDSWAAKKPDTELTSKSAARKAARELLRQKIAVSPEGDVADEEEREVPSDQTYSQESEIVKNGPQLSAKQKQSPLVSSQSQNQPLEQPDAPKPLKNDPNEDIL